MSCDRAPPPYGEKITIALFGKEQMIKAYIEKQLMCDDDPQIIMSNNVFMKESNSLKVVNSYSFFNEQYAQPDQHVIDFMALSYPGPHLFILATDSDTQEEELMAQIQKLKDTFGEDISPHLIIMLQDAQAYNSLCHLSGQNLNLRMLSENVANDCKKWCTSRRSFIFDYKTYSQTVVHKRRAALEMKRDVVQLQHGPPDEHSMSVSLTRATIKHPVGPLEQNGACASDNMLNIVLLGLTGTGKSASANTILSAGNPKPVSQQLFKSEPSSLPVTTKCEAKIVKLFGGHVRVIDTPDFLSDQLHNCQAHVEECQSYLKLKLCVVLLVLQLSRFTDNEAGILDKLEEKLGCEFRKRTTVLLTHGEDLKGKLDQFLKSHQPLWDIIEKCNYRYHQFHNNSKDTKQVRRLLKKIPNWESFFPYSIPQEPACPLI